MGALVSRWSRFVEKLSTSKRASRARAHRRSVALDALEPRVVLSLSYAMVADVNVSTAGSYPQWLTTIGTTTFFRANDGVTGMELWKTDGTAAGTIFLKDIQLGPGSSYPSDFLSFNGMLFFTAHDGVSGRELWRSDGTAAGTQRVKDIYAGHVSSYPLGLSVSNGALFFSADDGQNGRELWKTNGTAAGTVLVEDIVPGSGSSYPGSMTDVNGTLFFSATDDNDDNELWKSDGTAAGTTLVKNIYPGGYSYSYYGEQYYYPYSSYPDNLTRVGGKLYFTADDGKSGVELWVSDGTSAGTTLVRNIWNGSGSSYPSYLTELGGTLYFAASHSTSGTELWKSDGTNAGTTIVKNIVPGVEGAHPYELTAVNGVLYFFGGSPSAKGLWRSNGTSAGTTLVKEFTFPDRYGPGRWATEFAGRLYFSANDDVNGWELWSSDGTAAGTNQVVELSPGAAWSAPGFLTPNGDRLLFSAHDGVRGFELWSSDGTAAGTQLVRDIRSQTLSSNPANLTGVGGTIYFSAFDNANGTELWKTDGTAAGTSLVKDIAAGQVQWYYGVFEPASSQPAQLTDVNGVLFFTAVGQLFTSRGTAESTLPLPAQGPGALTSANGTLFFTAYDEVHGIELWKSDGTAVGTTLVKDIYPGTSTWYGYYGGTYTSPNSSGPSRLTAFNGKLYFTAYNAESGTELWRSDGTAAGTVMVKDIVPGAQSGFPTDFRIVDGVLYFVANGSELWRSDGTAQGTQPVVALGSYRGALTYVDGTFFYVGQSTDGIELWKTDGTVAGTSMVADIFPGTYSYSGYYGYWTGPNSSSPTQLTSHDGMLFFTADDGIHGRELWKSDGTPSGTLKVADLNTVGGSSPTQLLSVGGRLFFTAHNSQWQQWLWTTDGTTAGTFEVTTMPVGLIAAVNNSLYFVSSDGLHGYELWKVTDGASVPPPAISIDDVTVVEGHEGTRSATFTVSLSRPSTQTVTVAYQTENGTAAAKSDFLTTSGTLTFAPGQTTQTITVLVRGDRRGENDELFYVNLSNAINATIADEQALATIVDDEPRISINDVSILEGNSGKRLLVFTVTLSLAYDQLVTMSYKTSDGHAKVADLDYVAQTGVLSFAPGQTSQTISIEIQGDTKVEPNQGFAVNLSAKSANALFAKKKGIGTILNDD